MGRRAGAAARPAGRRRARAGGVTGGAARTAACREAPRPHTRQCNGATTRAKDLVDFILVGQHERVDAKRLKDAIQRTFARRGTHPVPEHLPEPPPELAVAYRREAEVVGVVTSLEEAHKLAVQWLNPVLACTARGNWDPGRAQWAE